jgi:hypothetical protein
VPARASVRQGRSARTPAGRAPRPRRCMQPAPGELRWRDARPDSGAGERRKGASSRHWSAQPPTPRPAQAGASTSSANAAPAATASRSVRRRDVRPSPLRRPPHRHGARPMTAP